MNKFILCLVHKHLGIVRKTHGKFKLLCHYIVLGFKTREI